MLAQAVAAAMRALGISFVGTDRELDIGDAAAVRAFAAQHTDFTHVINCAAYTQVDLCETETATATRVNVEGPANIAAAAQGLRATALHVSTDYVFAGDGAEPYREADPTGPQSAYGKTKLAGEQQFLAALSQTPGYVVRTSWLFGHGGKNFVSTMLRLMRERDAFGVVADQVGRPTFCDDLAAALLRVGGLTGPAAPAGIYHFANAGVVSWHGFAEAIAATARQYGEALRCQRIDPLTTAQYPLPARRPAYSVLSTDKLTQATGMVPRAWQAALSAYLTTSLHAGTAST